MNEIFEDIVFDSMYSKKSKTASNNVSVDFGSEVKKNILKFDSVFKKKRTARVIPVNSGEYRVNGLDQVLAYGFLETIKGDNQNVNFEFTEDLMNFEPDEDLVKKSKVPLWVIQPLNSQSVLIKRVW
jgi:hypothetical protein